MLRNVSSLRRCRLDQVLSLFTFLNLFRRELVNFCETFCICSYSSLRQDLTVKNAKKILLLFLFGLLKLKMVFFNLKKIQMDQEAISMFIVLIF